MRIAGRLFLYVCNIFSEFRNFSANFSKVIYHPYPFLSLSPPRGALHIMASRQIIHSNPVLLSRRSESLLWSLQNFTQDFLAESLIHDTKAYNNFLKSNKLSFRISDWISHPSSSYRHVNNTKKCSTTSICQSRANLRSLIASSHFSFQLVLQPRVNLASSYSTASTLAPNTSVVSIIMELRDIVATDAMYLKFDRLSTLISALSESDDTSLIPQLMKERRSIYDYLAGCPRAERLHVIEHIFQLVPPKRRTKYDFAAKVKACVDLAPNLVEGVLRESLSHISHKGVLELLFSTFKHIYSQPEATALDVIPDRNYFCLNLYHSIMLKQLGTLKLLDTDQYKTERIILHFLIKKNTQLTMLLRRLMVEKPAFAQMLATTCLDIEHYDNNQSAVLDIWRVKEDLNLGSSFDLFRVMGALLHLKDYSTGLRIYERNPDLHADWLYDIVLKTYAFKQDWEGMQRVYEGLFGRGDLPNIKHYTIVMEAISKIAGVDIVDFMYQNIKARKLKPTIAIHNSLMYARYALGDVKAVKEAMERIKEDGLEPDARSYMILLMTYRDSRDITSAMGVLGKMSKNGMSVSRAILTTLLSLCAERKDPLNAEKVFKWVSQLGHSADLICYNSLLECYVESHSFKKADGLFLQMKNQGMPLRIDTITIMFQYYARMQRTSDIAELYNEMSRLQILPDAKFYSVMLEYLVKAGKFQEAEQMLLELENTAIESNIYHYTILMRGYMEHHLFSKACEVYERLESKKLTPTFETIAVLIECLQRDDRDYGINGAGETLLNEYLNGDRRMDLTSKYLPRNILNPEIYKAVLHGYARRGDADKVPELLEKLKENGGEHHLAENTVILRKLAEIYGMANQWDNFDKYWTLLRENLVKQYVPTRQFNTGRVVSAIPKTERFSNDKVFRLKFQEMMQFGEIEKIIPLILKLEREGFQLSNTTHNQVVSLLSTDDSTLAQSYKFAEKRLLHGSLKRMHAQYVFKNNEINADQKRRLIGYYKISYNSISVLTNNFDRLLANIARDNKCETEAEALQLYKEKHPRITKFILRELRKPRRDNMFQYY